MYLRFILAISLVLAGVNRPIYSQEQQKTASGHYLFAWTGDAANLRAGCSAECGTEGPKGYGPDFLAVIDANPSSPSYGHLLTTVATDQPTMYVHHTEYTMPASGMLFANDHEAGRTFIFDVRDPQHPTIETSFTDMAGYMHPHSFVRVPNGHVLATFQHAHHGKVAGHSGTSGGLVEIDDQGKVVRANSNADPTLPDALLSPYGLVVLPDSDRVVSTNSSMHQDDVFRGVTYQLWRLSDLKLLKTEYLDVGENRYSQISPEEPRLGPDGSIFVQTLSCGLERITGVSSDQPKSRLVYTFPGNWCGVPTVVGNYLVQSVPAEHALIVLDIRNGATPVEVSRLKISDTFKPHWTGWDAKTQRLVVTGREPRLFLVKLDQATGALTMDASFHADGKPGFNFANREWPHGWRGSGLPHGVVFSR
jgi:56kDa selenium binding protein (SBP56)